MGTTTSQLRPQLDDRIRDYPEDDVWESDEPDYYPDGDYSWTGWPAEFRWRPVAAILGAVVAIGAIATAVIINSGDSASTKATVVPSMPRTATSAPAAPKTTASASPSTAPQLPPETVTTVPRTVPPSALPATPTVPVTPPVPAPTAAPAPTLAPPAAAVDPRTVVYTVTGSKQLLDLVNIVYTDARGYPQTEFNVSLPWSKVIVLDPGVQTVSVVATSFYGRLNCSVVNAAGQPVVTSANNGSLATCTR